MKHFYHNVLVLGAMACLPVSAYAHPLNDSGQQGCFDATGKLADCSAVADDGRYGRDAAAEKKPLQKAGGGRAGFDFTKIANDGSDLPRSATLGGQAGDWACTRDNVTGLWWEVKTASATDLRFGGHRYAWYLPIPAFKGVKPSWAGETNRDVCRGVLLKGECNTQTYLDAVNAGKLCGFSDWRLPNTSELLSVLDYGAKKPPLIDVEYFPNTASAWYWVQSAYAMDPVQAAWDIDFGKGWVGVGNMDVNYAVRLVRGKP